MKNDILYIHIRAHTSSEIKTKVNKVNARQSVAKRLKNKCVCSVSVTSWRDRERVREIVSLQVKLKKTQTATKTST